MNAAANRDDEVERLREQIASLRAQRERLLAEVSRLREARNSAFTAAADAQRENRELRNRITELGGDA